VTDTEEVERLKNALVAAEEALADAESDRFRWRGSIEGLVDHLWTTLPAEQVLQLQEAIKYRALPIPAPPRPEDALRVESANRLSEIEALGRTLKDEERARVKLEAVVFDKEAYLRQLEARVVELASESSANETAYSHQCNKTASFESEAEDLRKQLDGARHTLVGISDARLEDWQRILERAEKAEARVQALEHELEGCSHVQPAECSAHLREARERIRHLESRIAPADGDSDLLLCDSYDKAVCDAAGEMPEDALRDWLANDPFAHISVFLAVVKAELARREARRHGG
jgi:predicted  nucleic acid-binding Zn-ribbon protein